MDALIAEAVQYVAAILLLAAGVFFVLLVVLQWGRIGETFFGVSLVLWSIVTGPFHFVKSVLDKLATSVAEEESFPPREGPLLLKRLLFAGQVTAVLVALVILSSGLALGWFAMVPDREHVEAYRQARSERANLQREMREFRSSIAHLDSVWRADSAQLVTAHAQTFERRVSRLSDWRRNIRSDFSRRSPVARGELVPLVSLLESAPSGGNEAGIIGQFDRRVRELERNVSGLQPATLGELGFETGDLATLRQYADRWREERRLSRTLASWPTGNVRGLVQPDYGTSQERMERSRERLAQVEAVLPRLRTRAEWDQVSFVTRAGGAVLLAFGFVWLVGLIMELASVHVSMAENLRRIRGQLEPADSEPPSSPTEGPP